MTLRAYAIFGSRTHFAAAAVSQFAFLRRK